MAQLKIKVRRNPSTLGLTEVDLRKLHEQISDMTIEVVPADSIKTNPRNAKRHPEQQILLIAENMRKLGVYDPILIDENNMIIGGHARMAAAKLLKLATVPSIRLPNLSAQEKRAVALADNKLAELGTWDPGMLSLELKELTADTAELAFDYSITGFDTVEIDRILGDDASLDRPDPADAPPWPAAADMPVTNAGDLWVCGNHHLYCGGPLESASYRALLGGVAAHMVFTDPLHNAHLAGRASRRANVGEPAMGSGDPSSEEFIEFLQTACAHIAANVVDGAVIYLCMDWWHHDDLSAATRRYFGKPKDMVVWVKTNSGRGAFYRSQHEHIAVYVAGTAAPTNNFRLGQRGRYRANVWNYPGFNTFERDQDSDLSGTEKPVALIVDALRDCSRRGETVLDPFGGSGTTMMAAERTGRLGRLIEIDPIYCDVIVRRWQKISGKSARLAESKETFSQIEARRRHADGGEE